MRGSAAYDIAKIYIWKQITTSLQPNLSKRLLLMILQRYTFGSKSQHFDSHINLTCAAYDIAKIYIWKQITTLSVDDIRNALLLMILQRYTFGSKSQRRIVQVHNLPAAYDIAKIYIWKQITTYSLAMK